MPSSEGELIHERVYTWHPDGRTEVFAPTTIRALGYDEAFLEARLAEHPELLGMTSLASGIQGPLVVFRQLSLSTPSGRTVNPDIVLVSRSAHLVVVEVKLEDNPELMSRAVVSQVVDYASAISALARQGELASLFSPRSQQLEGLCDEWFADGVDAREFAEVLEKRCMDGDIDLVIACDRCPPGLEELGEAIHRQSALAFRMHVVEVRPFVAADGGSILFQRRVRSRTEIVARTHVRVSWEGGAQPATVHVETTPLEQQEEALVEAASGQRRWSTAEIQANLEGRDDLSEIHRSVLIRLLETAVRLSFNGQITVSKTRHPTFGWRAGKRLRTVFSATPGYEVMWIHRSGLRATVPDAEAEGLEGAFAEAAGDSVEIGSEYISLPLDRLVGSMDRFEEVCERVAALANSDGIQA